MDPAFLEQCVLKNIIIFLLQMQTELFHVTTEGCIGVQGFSIKESL